MKIKVMQRDINRGLQKKLLRVPNSQGRDASLEKTSCHTLPPVSDPKALAYEINQITGGD